MSRNIKAIVFATALGALLVAALTLPVQQWLSAGLQWIDAHRGISWAVFIVSYIAATVLVFPGSILTLGAGFVFGLPIGVALVSVGSVLGATAAFLVGRFFARDWVKGRVAGLPKFRALDQATHHEGFLIVLLVRLSPLFPFNLTNYGLGLTAVHLRDYFFASWIGMLPGTIVYVYLGTLALDLTQLSTGSLQNGIANRSLLVGGFIATVVLAILIAKKATQALNRHLDDSETVAENNG
jgi:uncharacterized membrane protein YdjX (TVP38/TMEM64 family)